MKDKKRLDSAYQGLIEKGKEIFIVQSAASVLNWDMETKMPPKGIALRSQQLAVVARVAHRMITDPEIGNLLDRIEGYPEYDTLDGIQKRNVELTRKAYNEFTKLPEELVAETERQRAITVDTWKKAKAAKDFGTLKPELEKLVELRREAGEILMEVKQTATPYDALIDHFEPWITAETIAGIFDELKEGLISIMRKCLGADKQPDSSILRRRVPVDAQRRISESLAEFLGYDVKSDEAGGRIDETEHPFTSGYYDDVRITTHYYEDRPMSSLFSVLHEAGHALYDQNLPGDWMFQPVGNASSYGIHESQSRFVENILGRSYEFWSYYLPTLNEFTGNIFSDVDLDDFVLAVNQVEPSKIRVEADEITYGLHIILRFEMERLLFAGSIGVDELPDIWNRKYKDYLGVEIENDSEGVMQDIHWAGGYYGYFPTYALGNIYSGQILAAMERDLPNWKAQIAQGSFKDVKRWLVKNIHSCGALYDPQDLIREVTGQEIDVRPYLSYLDEKYSKLYGY